MLDAPRLVGGAQGVLCFSSALTIVSSLCIQAVSATFFVFPAASNRVYSVRSTGLWRVPTRAAIYSAARTVLRPPQTLRLPRRVPLSRLSGGPPPPPPPAARGAAVAD